MILHNIIFKKKLLSKASAFMRHKLFFEILFTDLAYEFAQKCYSNKFDSYGWVNMEMLNPMSVKKIA